MSAPAASFCSELRPSSDSLAPTLLPTQFDKAASQTLAAQLKNKCTTKAKLQTYRNCDEVRAVRRPGLLWRGLTHPFGAGLDIPPARGSLQD